MLLLNAFVSRDADLAKFATFSKFVDFSSFILVLLCYSSDLWKIVCWNFSLNHTNFFILPSFFLKSIFSWLFFSLLYLMIDFSMNIIIWFNFFLLFEMRLKWSHGNASLGEFIRYKIWAWMEITIFNAVERVIEPKREKKLPILPRSVYRQLINCMCVMINKSPEEIYYVRLTFFLLEFWSHQN